MSRRLAVWCLLLVATFSAVATARPPSVLVCIADDASWAHFGANGERAIRTPHFDRVAREGVNFTRAFASSPSCTPSRAALLTGQDFWRLGSTANLWSAWPRGLQGYPDRLAAAGWAVGAQGKGWGPGDFRAGGRTNNPAGPAARDFRTFLRSVGTDQPFCFWYGSTDPHRPYDAGSGARAGIDPASVTVPPFLPDTPEVRGDLGDYLAEVQRFDAQLGDLLAALAEAGRLDDTLVIVTSDNGMPFPRAKANVYDAGARVPLAIRWPTRIPAGRVVDDLVDLADLAPTILEAAGLPLPAEMSGRSLWPVLGTTRMGWVDPTRDDVVIGRERHAAVRAGNLSYPVRALRTPTHLFIRNFTPERWPAGDPPVFGDVDDHRSADTGPAKRAVVRHDGSPGGQRLFDLAFARRPAEELYDLAADPWQTNNLAAEPAHAAARDALRTRLDEHLRRTGDPRAGGGGLAFEQHAYTGAFNSGQPIGVGAALGVPLLDLSAQPMRQVTVDIKPGQYLGHPTTVLLEDGRTMFCAYPTGHGKGAIRLKRSADGGRSWSAPRPVPENWATSLETPTIHRVTRPDGAKRLLLWSGLFPARRALSDDEGATWTPLEPAGDWGGIVVMGSVESVRDAEGKVEPGRFLAWFHDDGRFIRAGAVPEQPPVFTLFQTETRDGGTTWASPRELVRSGEVHLCEPGAVRSPDGRQLALLLRENRRVQPSHVVFSEDEGVTWTAPRPLPPALTGDRHVARYAPDGRLVVTFRDMAEGSPTRGDWVIWVGRYEDLAAGRPGQFRARLMDNRNAWDCGYAGLEVLPDGTFVATSYGHWLEGQPPFVVSVRFRLDELDAAHGRR